MPKMGENIDVTIYSDSLLRACVVAGLGDQLFIVPRCQGGWSNRQRLRMTDQARAERLKPARGVKAAWLGVPGGDADQMTA